MCLDVRMAHWCCVQLQDLSVMISRANSVTWVACDHHQEMEGDKTRGHRQKVRTKWERRTFCQSLYYFLGNCVKVNFASIGWHFAWIRLTCQRDCDCVSAAVVDDALHKKSSFPLLLTRNYSFHYFFSCSFPSLHHEGMQKKKRIRSQDVCCKHI